MDRALRQYLRVDSATPVGGGCVHECFEVTIGGRDFFLKSNDADQADNFAAEADGLAALRKHGVRAPEPISHGSAGDQAYLLLELLDLKGNGDWAALGRMLAGAHRRHGTRFGWSRDNYIGATPQANGWCEDWATFWIERRLAPKFRLARLEMPELGGILEGHSRRHRCSTEICGAGTRGSRGTGRWCSTRRCTTATARRTSR
jgi:fructosamine-3-kinase